MDCVLFKTLPYCMVYTWQSSVKLVAAYLFLYSEVQVGNIKFEYVFNTNPWVLKPMSNKTHDR